MLVTLRMATGFTREPADRHSCMNDQLIDLDLLRRLLAFLNSDVRNEHLHFIVFNPTICMYSDPQMLATTELTRLFYPDSKIQTGYEG